MNRIRARLRHAADDEGGFTLIELLIVMLVLGNLAAIALPAFYGQRAKAHDARAKVVVHSAQVAMETCATANLGLYTSCNLAALRVIEPTIPATGVTVTTPSAGYTVTAAASNGNTYSVVRSSTGSLTYPCTVASTQRGGCPGAGVAAGVWG